MFRAFFRLIGAIIGFVIEQTRELRAAVALPLVTVGARVGWEAVECYAVGSSFDFRLGIHFRFGVLNLGFWSIWFKAPFTFDGQAQREALRNVFRIISVHGPFVEALRARAARRRRQQRLAARASLPSGRPNIGRKRAIKANRRRGRTR